MYKYVMSDIHGSYSKFIEMLELINFSIEDQIYILGDIIDRGNGGIEILRYIIANTNIHLVRGNHEELMLRYLTTDNKIESEEYLTLWLENGGSLTIKSLINLNKNDIDSIINYIFRAPDYIIVDKYILTHAGFSIKVTNLTPDSIKIYPREVIFQYDRNFMISDNYFENYITILGHTKTSTNHIEHKGNKINIDCGCGVKGGRLACLCLDTMEEFYIE